MSTTTIIAEGWFMNLSSASFTEAQKSLLAHGPIFAISPGHQAYITAVEQAFPGPEPKEIEEFTRC